MTPENKYYRNLGQNTLRQLRALHSTNLRRELTMEMPISQVMLAMFGTPSKCLVCEKDLQWETRRIPDDVDPWFCSYHCPICSSDEELFGK